MVGTVDWTPEKHSEIRYDAHISGAWPGCVWLVIPADARLWGALMGEQWVLQPLGANHVEDGSPFGLGGGGMGDEACLGIDFRITC